MKAKGSRIFKAVSWVMIGYFLSQVLRLGTNLVMTRFLAPEMFGVMALSQVFLYVLAMISDVGISPSIIRSKRGEVPAFLNTAWTIQIIRGAIICMLVIGVAFGLEHWQSKGWIDENSAFSETQLPIIMMVMAFTAFISGFKSTNLILANRNMQLKRLTQLDFFSQVVGVLVMVIWAFLEPSVWALVGGALLSSLTLVLLSHFAFSGVRNRFHIDKSALHEIIKFGKWILLSSIITALLNQGDRLIFGSLISAEELGIYSIALFLSTAVLHALMKLNSMVFLPLLSEVARDRPNDLGDVYYRIRRTMDAVSFSAAGFLYAFGEKIIEILYDERYQAAGPMLKILSLGLLLTSPSISSAVYFAIGKPKYVTILVAIESFAKLTLLPTLFYIGGMELAVWAIALFTLSILPLDFYYKNRVGFLNIKREFMMLPLFVPGYAAGVFFAWLL